MKLCTFFHTMGNKTLTTGAYPTCLDGGYEDSAAVQIGRRLFVTGGGNAMEIFIKFGSEYVSFERAIATVQTYMPRTRDDAPAPPIGMRCGMRDVGTRPQLSTTRYTCVAA